MKKFLCMILSLVMLLTCLDLGIVLASSDTGIQENTEIILSDALQEKNFLPVKDSTFESGATAWSGFGSGSVSVVDKPSGTGKALAFSGYTASTTWSSPILNVKSLIQDNMTEAGSIYVYMNVYCEKPFSATVRFRTNDKTDFSLCEKEGNAYCSLGSISVGANVWTPVEIEVPITEGDLFKSSGAWKLCLDGFVDDIDGATVYFDNMYVGLESVCTGEIVEIPEKTEVTRSDYTKVGTIRWDAFTKSTVDGSDPASQVARVLSPAKYHSQAPFFATVNDDGTVSFPEYTVETWEKEADYAHDAGLDYFAYLWYETSSAMSQPRKYHLQSSKKELIEMTGILETIRSTQTMNELFVAMNDPVWLRLDGRPVVFLYGIKTKWDATMVKQLRQMAANAGIKEALYIVGMDANYGNLDAVYSMDIDAVSWYSKGAQTTAMPYADYAATVLDEIENTLASSSTVAEHQVIPCFSTGRDSRARIETGVSWVDGDPNAENDIEKPYYNRYSLQPTMNELKEHIANTYFALENNEAVTEANLICSYAWNEHDEGGWLCPTLNCDEDGNMILDENGNPTVNDERIKAFKEVMQFLREDPVSQIPTPEPNAIKTVYNGDAEAGTANWANLHGGSVSYVQPGANGTGNAIKFTPIDYEYSTVAYDFGAAIINDSQYNYAGCGAGKYEISFYAKAAEGHGGKFSVMLSSRWHLEADGVRTKLGYVEGDGNYVSATFMGSGTTIEMTEEWQKFTATISVTQNWLNMMKKLRDLQTSDATRAYNLVLRLDGSKTAFSTETFEYYIDEFTIKYVTNNNVTFPTPTPKPDMPTPTPVPTAIPEGSVVDYLDYTVENNEVTITKADTDIHGDVTIPSLIEGLPVTGIGDEAFRYCMKLTGVTVPDSITSIGDKAFERCFSLKTVKLSNALKYLGKHAFCSCERLSGNITITSSTEEIGQYAFYGCKNLATAEYLGTENHFRNSVAVMNNNEALTDVITFTRGDITGAVLNLGSTLTINYYASFDLDINDVYMRFTSSSGRVTDEVKGTYDSKYGMYRFSYEKINPQCMTDIITAELVHSDGSVLATRANYSVKAYCDRLLNKTTAELGYTPVQYNAFKNLLADMLAYGAESQRYTGYRLGMLADTSSWIDAYRGIYSSPKGVRTVKANTDGNNKVTALGLRMSNANNIYFKLVLNDDDVIIRLNGKDIDRSQLVDNGNNTYILYTEDITATDFDKVYTLKLIQNDSVISEVSYNMIAYVQSKYNDDKVGGIVKALYGYGAAAKKYVSAMNDPDDSFDLDAEDDLETIINYIPEKSSNFNSVSKVSETAWTTIGTATLGIKAENGNQYLAATRDTEANSETVLSYSSPKINIAPYLKKEGIYEISFKYKVQGANSAKYAFAGIIRTDKEYSFSKKQNETQYHRGLSQTGIVENDKWYTYTETLVVLGDDVKNAVEWNFCMHSIQANITEIAIDDFVITDVLLVDEEPKSVSVAETWVANEIVIVSDREYVDPYTDVDVDLILTDGNVTYTIPGFWAGGKTWKIRFMCPTAGVWTYRTVCTDETNTGLHNQTNTVICSEYSGELELYKRGHVKINDGYRYFTYNDNTPFFYLADTHWSLGAETVDMVKIITERRVEQNYSVIQSEPLSAAYDLKNGISVMDLKAFSELDEKFRIIADAGLMHVNASFFYPSEMTTFINNHGGYEDTPMEEKAIHSSGEYDVYDLKDETKAALERMCRYWVARYSAFPVMWSLGQEVDNDFFWNREDFNGHEQWCYVNNPYHYVAEYISKYDAYAHPMTAHMEGTGNVRASTSSFRDMNEHDFFGAQWSPHLTGETNNHDVAKDFYFEGYGKPVVNYEGRYCYLWTKNFGARAQGWIAFLSGMCGYAYGAQDTWSYLNRYNEEVNSSDGVDNITAEEKQAATWQDSLIYPSSNQVGYMRSFFEDTVGEWYDLIPRFDDASYLTRTVEAYANIASNADNSKIVIYFFNFSDKSVAELPNTYTNGQDTGTLGNLDKYTSYKYRWFDPINNTYSDEGTLYSYTGSVNLPLKPAGTDYVLYVYK